ncbi:hypothetical protein LSAT2_009490 [Lamellibrachia satsuma]|nr:hypothetical protein LSAT2_009490 [Lamellibrachia satsuma]
MFEYAVCLLKLPQGSTQDVLWAYEEVALVKDIVIDIRQIADAEYSDIYKMTADMNIGQGDRQLGNVMGNRGENVAQQIDSIRQKYKHTMHTQTDLDYDHAGYLPRIPAQRTMMGYDDGVTAQRARSSMGAIQSSSDPYGFHYEDAHRDRFTRLSLDQQIFNGQVVTTTPLRRSLRSPDAGSPIFRSGRLGGPWRHITQVTGNLGNHICFVDGTVKLTDTQKYPPFGLVDEHRYIGNSMPNFGPNSSHQVADSRWSKYNQHAKQGMKYWYQEKFPTSGPPKQTIGGRLMKLGIGY